MLYYVGSSRMWRNWQTRMIQVHVRLLSQGFKSPHPHLIAKIKNWVFTNPKEQCILSKCSSEYSIHYRMRECWNWQTGMTKDHVSTDVRVQVPFSALSKLIVNAVSFLHILILFCGVIDDYSNGYNLFLKLGGECSGK